MGLRDALFGPARDDIRVVEYIEAAAAAEDDPNDYAAFVARRKAAGELPRGVVDQLNREVRR